MAVKLLLQLKIHNFVFQLIFRVTVDKISVHSKPFDEDEAREFKNVKAYAASPDADKIAVAQIINIIFDPDPDGTIKVEG